MDSDMASFNMNGIELVQFHQNNLRLKDLEKQKN